MSPTLLKLRRYARLHQDAITRRLTHMHPPFTIDAPIEGKGRAYVLRDAGGLTHRLGTTTKQTAAELRRLTGA